MFLGIELCRFGICSRSDDPDHFSLDNSFRKSWIFDLFANRNFVTGFNQLRNIEIGRMPRDAAHRNRCVLVPVAAGQRNIQDFGCNKGVLIKHLIEIAHAEKKDRFRMFLFNAAILLQHRCDR